MELIDITYPNGDIGHVYPDEICKCGKYLKGNNMKTCIACQKFTGAQNKPVKKKSSNQKKT